MRKFRMPRCPYCGARLNAAQAWALRRRGEYICPKCGGLSNVVLDPLLKGLGSLAVLLGAAFFTAGLFLGLEHAPWVLPGVLLPFLAFYAVCVFLVRLRKPRRKSRSRPGGVPPQAPARWGERRESPAGRREIIRASGGNGGIPPGVVLSCPTRKGFRFAPR